MVNFLDSLNDRIEDIVRPPNLPVGTYRASVQRMPSHEESNDGKWKFINVQMKLLEAMDDVDQDELQKYGGLGPQATLRYRFMFGTEDSPESEASNGRTKFNLKRFLTEHLKVQGDTLNEALANALGQECLVTIRWRPDKNDPEIQYAEVGRTAPLD